MYLPSLPIGEKRVDRRAAREGPQDGVADLHRGHLSQAPRTRDPEFSTGSCLDRLPPPRYTPSAREGKSNAGSLVFDKWTGRDGKPIGNP